MDIPFGGAVAEAAYEHVRGVLDPAVLNHSVRVWLLADHVGRREGVRGREREALAVACLFHDAGTARAYDGPQRFEVEGADAAVAFLHGHGCHALLVRRVWEAVALHTSPGIAERMGTLPRLVRLGVLADFGAEDVLGPGDAEELAPLLSGLPRRNIEIVLADAVVEQALRRPEKAPPATWPGGLLAAHLSDPGRPGPNPAF
ncbi:HD domain-containing protein [Streptomyces sp. ME01-24h]|nr:HD domain-containing protein [Streptomyces sp. ME19-03-3]MDX3352405.1 HD domain-containing protein [Streptomyces sp. ME01-24h]